MGQIELGFFLHLTEEWLFLIELLVVLLLGTI